MRFEWPEFGRCCFCLPLRRGVITFGYVILILNIILVIAESIVINQHAHPLGLLIYKGVMIDRMPSEICLVMSLVDLVFDSLLLYGAHKKVTRYIKVFYYYGLTTTIASVVLRIVEVILSGPYWVYQIDVLLFSCTGLVIQIYLLSLIRSLLKKLERAGPHHYENQILDHIVTDNGANIVPKSNNRDGKSSENENV